MSTDFCIVSFPRDYEWLDYCLRSVRKSVSGYRDVLLFLPAGAPRPDIDLSRCRVLPDVPMPNGYVGQQVTKMRAYRHTDADFVAFLDSDHVCDRAHDVASYTQDGKPILYRRDWSAIPPEWRVWRELAASALGHDPEWFTIESQPFVYRRDTLELCCDQLERVHRRSLEDFSRAFKQALGFSEFVVLGDTAARRQHDDYVFRLGPNPEPKFLWHWSYSGVTAEHCAKFEEILAR